MMAAEAGIEVGTFNVAWLCEENKVINLKLHHISSKLVFMHVYL